MRQLPVGKTFSHIVASTLNNLRFAFFAQWPWVAVLSVLLVGMHITTGVFGLSEEQFNLAIEQNPAVGVTMGAWIAVIGIAAFLAFASMAVSWHRYILTDEIPKGWAKLRMDGLVWRYLGNLLLIALLVSLVAIPFFVVVAMVISALGLFGMIVLIVAAAVVLVPLIYRISVKLPAVALGRRDFKIRDAWNATEDNWWQFVGVGLLLTAVSWLAGILLLGISLALQKLLPTTAAAIADLFIQLGANWVLTILGITLLTSLYGFFVEGRDF